MNDRAEIERLLNQTGRTLEGLPECYTDEQTLEVYDNMIKGRGLWENVVLHQSDVIELLVGALRDALDKPMQKPMTLDEIAKNSVVWLEDKGKENIIPAIVGYIIDHEIVLHSVKCSFVPSLDEYGKRWRAWASRPTDEEREAAAWET